MRVRTGIEVISTAAGQILENDTIMMAAALAFYASLSLAPLLMIFISVAGFISPDAQVKLIQQVEAFVGPEASDIIGLVINSAAQNQTAGMISTVIGTITLLLWTTAVFAHLQKSMNRIWGVQARPGHAVWAYLRKRLLSLIMVAVVGFLLLASVVASAALTMIFSNEGSIWLVLNFAVTLLVFVVLFAMVFKFLPDLRIGWRDVWGGAVITAILFSVGKWATGKYLGYKTVDSMYGAAGSLIVLLLWVYYVSVIAFFGAELTRAYAVSSGSQIVPLSHAMWSGSPNIK